MILAVFQMAQHHAPKQLKSIAAPFKLACPSLPTMMWSCTAMPSGRANATTAYVISMSAREGVGSPDGRLCTRMIRPGMLHLLTSPNGTSPLGFRDLWRACNYPRPGPTGRARRCRSGIIRRRGRDAGHHEGGQPRPVVGRTESARSDATAPPPWRNTGLSPPSRVRASGRPSSPALARTRA